MSYTKTLSPILQNLKDLLLLLKEIPESASSESLEALALAIEKVDQSSPLPSAEDLESLFHKAQLLLEGLGNLRHSLGEKIEAAGSLKEGLTQYARINKSLKNN
jgi:predicted RNase H-like HicB family nuclease